MTAVIESCFFSQPNAHLVNQRGYFQAQGGWSSKSTSSSSNNHQAQPHKANPTHRHHKADLFCFQTCSIWVLSLVTSIDKKPLSSCSFNGALNQPLNSMVALAQAIPQEIVGYLPIDLRKHQRFVLEPYQGKMNLNIVFDLMGQLTLFTNVNSLFAMSLFDINLIGDLHGNQMLKDSIDFKVKGFDIQKAITSVLNGKGLSHLVARDHLMTRFNAVVFSNIQCTFEVEFCISNVNLEVYYALMEKRGGSGRMYVANLGIVITKLRIVYTLPLCVFAKENYHGSQLVSYLSQQEMTQQRLFKLNYLQKPQPLAKGNTSTSRAAQRNFCNWHSFMTYTTPMVFECEKLLIKDILNAFVKPSLFGIKCIFQSDPNHYTQVNYFPSLSSISIEEIKRMAKSQIKNPGSPFLHRNDSATTDESLLTHSSSHKEDFSSPLNKTVFHNEKTQELFNTKTFNEQLKTFFKLNPSCEELTLNDISPQSWFAITWTPSKTNQSKGFHENTDINWSQSSSFKVFYKFKLSSPASAQFISVVGLLEKSIRGKTLSTSTSPQANSFWFSNFSSDRRSVAQFDNDKAFNMLSFNSLIEKGCKYESSSFNILH